ncbi:MAG: PQQ-dependent sugar dehydrogenase [Candidatus Limnocylindrales bacterium]
MPPATSRPALRLTAVVAAIGLVAAISAPAIARVMPSAPVAVSTSAQATIAQVVGDDFTKIVDGLVSPVFMTHAGDERLFVVERAGRIRIVEDIASDWQITGTFLNIKSLVGDGGSEQGLLGLAFHPEYPTNGLFYVYYTDNSGDDVVAEFQRQSFARADPDSYRRLLRIRDPFSNHNAGWMAFKGQYLYIADGDGGSGGDPFGNGQDKHTRLGKIMRIDPIDPDGNGPRRFSIPDSNPFVDQDGLDIIWSYGLRNPWRNSFDRVTGDLWIGDVGQGKWEEIDHVATGRAVNFGWNRLEGRHLYPSGGVCSSNCKTLPIIEYKHNVSGSDNCAVTGGYVSRRSGAARYGEYYYADFCSQRIWRVSADHRWGDAVGPPTDTSFSVSSFGEDAEGHLYVVDLGGSLWRIDGT